tara:strand:+ start:54 stop:656 length:603 start_codon:yes stop_codon:yes gene_type:complete
MALGLQLGLAGGGGAATLYGMWFDNVNDKVTIPKPAVTVDVKMKVTQAGSGTAGMTLASSNSPSTFLFASQSGSGSSIALNAGTPTITVDGVAVTTRGALFTALADGLEHEVIATDADLSSWTSLYLGNYSAAEVWVWEGMIRDVRFYNSSTDALIHQYDGYGNTDADWEDQVGSNDGTVAGSPARAVSVNGGATWAEES